MAVIFYDTETTGIDAGFDQILQFAAIRTDFELNELDRIETRCRLSSHIVPAPGAMRVTKVEAAKLFDPSLHSHYEMTCRIRESFSRGRPLSLSATTLYNSTNIFYVKHSIKACIRPTYAESDARRTGFRRKADSVPMIADSR